MSGEIPDAYESAWIRVASEWHRLDGTPPSPRVEAQSQGYGCDTGCIGHVLYLVRSDGSEERLDSEFYFRAEDAGREAAEHGERLGLPVVLEKTW